MGIKERIREWLSSWLHRLRIFMQRASKVFPFLILAVVLVGLVLSSVQLVRIQASMYTQDAARRWNQGKDGSRQLTIIARGQILVDGAPMAYLDPARSLNLHTVEEIRTNLGAIAEQSLRKDESRPSGVAGPEKRVWVDAYSSEAMSSVSAFIDGEEIQNVNASISGVGGYYELFHPMEILSGSFLPEEQVQMDTVVVNEQLAWALYRSSEVEDQKIQIGGRVYRIVGVVKDSRNTFEDQAGGTQARAYVYFEELIYLLPPESSAVVDMYAPSDMDAGVASEIDYSRLAIQSYEMVLPDPIRNIALNDLKQSLSMYQETAPGFHIINNTGRFGLLRLYDRFFPVGEDRFFLQGYSLPFGEIAARSAEQQCLFWWTIFFGSVILGLVSAQSVYLAIRRPKMIRRV